MEVVMSKETALQIAMRITQRYANSLFDEHTQRGRQFMQEMTECLEQEKKQIIAAYLEGRDDEDSAHADDTFERTYEDYYNETYGNKNENS
jgi:hypothetical protein